MDDKKLLFIVNPRAGKTKSLAPLFDLPPHLRHHHRLFRCRCLLGWQAEPLL